MSTRTVQFIEYVVVYIERKGLDEAVSSRHLAISLSVLQRQATYTRSTFATQLDGVFVWPTSYVT